MEKYIFAIAMKRLVCKWSLFLLIFSLQINFSNYDTMQEIKEVFTKVNVRILLYRLF
jgi:hypothetical protein